MTPRLRPFRLLALTLLTCALAFTRGDSAEPSPAHRAEPRTIRLHTLAEHSVSTGITYLYIYISYIF